MWWWPQFGWGFSRSAHVCVCLYVPNKPRAYNTQHSSLVPAAEVEEVAHQHSSTVWNVRSYRRRPLLVQRPSVHCLNSQIDKTRCVQEQSKLSWIEILCGTANSNVLVVTTMIGFFPHIFKTYLKLGFKNVNSAKTSGLFSSLIAHSKHTLQISKTEIRVHPLRI